jgi:hypothetical protein
MVSLLSAIDSFYCPILKEEGRRKKEEGKRKKEEGRRKKEEGRRKKEEGKRKKEEGRRKKEEGRRKKEELINHKGTKDVPRVQNFFTTKALRH